MPLKWEGSVDVLGAEVGAKVMWSMSPGRMESPVLEPENWARRTPEGSRRASCAVSWSRRGVLWVVLGEGGGGWTFMRFWVGKVGLSWRIR